MCVETINGMADTIADLEKKLAEREWIPVSERLPEDGYWLWSSTSGEVKIDFCWKGHWGQAEALGYDVIAWMPLPEPYGEDGEDE